MVSKLGMCREVCVVLVFCGMALMVWYSGIFVLVKKHLKSAEGWGLLYVAPLLLMFYSLNSVRAE